MEKITFVCTSCNRNDLLFKTLDSFLENNNYPIYKWIIKEDSGLENIAEEIRNKYNFISVISGENIGQASSTDLLYNNVETEYIFHCEEDWFFNRNNNNFIEQSLKILKLYPNIHQVWIREGMKKWSKNWKKLDDFNFGIIKDNHLDQWNGFTWNPGLRRLSDYKKIFPKGFQNHITTHKSGAIIERDCMLETKKFNYKAAILENCVCDHLGEINPTNKK